jgi:hypothetical protein
MWRQLAILVLIGISCSVLGAAASLSFSSASLGAAIVTVPHCTTAGLGVIQTLSGANVASVTVSNLPAGCGSAAVQVTVNNGAVNGSGSNTVPGAGGSVTITLIPTPAAATYEQTDIVLTGP